MAKETISIVIEGQDNASDDIRHVQQNMSNLSNQAQRTTGGMNGFAGGINTSTIAMGAMVAGGIAAAQQLASITLELNKLGAVTTQTQNVFEALSGELKDSSSLLNNLRKATKGVVTDTALMQGANQLMRMGLADNAQEIEQLIDMAVKLKQPTDTASEAVDNFAMMLANQSVERLDSFGISSAKVRAEIEKLIATGQALNREEAFKMAVLDLGADAVANLGSAVDESATEVAKLETRWQNFLDTIGQDVNTNIEITAKFINDVSDWSQTQEAQQQRGAFFTGQLFAGGYGGGTMGGNPMYGDQAMRDIAEAQRLERLRQMQINQLYATQYTRVITEADRIFLDSIQKLETQAQNVVINVAEAVALGMVSITPDFMSDPYLSTNLETVNQELEFYRQQLTELQQQGVNVTDIRSEVEELASVWDGVTSAVNNSIVSLEKLQSMSLDELLGRGAGDRQQVGLVDMLLGQVSDSEIRDTLQSSFALLTGQETELGQVVQNEIASEIARVAQSMGAEISFGMVEAVQNALQTGEYLGMSDDEIIKMIRDMMPAITPGPMPAPAGMGGMYTVQPDDSPWSILANMGIPASQIPGMVGMFAPYGTLQPGMQIGLPGMGGAQPAMPYQNIFGMPTDFPSFLGGEDGEGFQPIESIISEDAMMEVDQLKNDFQAIDTKMIEIQNRINAAFQDTSMRVTVNVDLNISDEDRAIFNATAGNQYNNNLGQPVQTIPGGSSRTS